MSVRSARWTGEIFVETLEADHLNELGWWPEVHDPVERAARERESKAFYLGMAEDLAKRFPL